MATPQRRRLLLANQAAPLLRATFTAADGTALGSYQPEIGPKFVVGGGAMQIAGNQVNATAFDGDGAAWAYADLGRADAVTALDALWPDALTGPIGLVFRAALAPLSYTVALLRPQSVAGVRIIEVSAHVFTQRVSAPLTVSLGVTYRVVVRIAGAQLDVYLNGLLVASWPTATQNPASSLHGFYRDGFTNGKLDNYVAYGTSGLVVPGGVV
jgi:hypothetical protein